MSPGKSKLSQWSRDSHTLRGGIDSGGVRFGPWVVEVVIDYRKNGLVRRCALYRLRVRRDLEAFPKEEVAAL